MGGYGDLGGKGRNCTMSDLVKNAVGIPCSMFPVVTPVARTSLSGTGLVLASPEAYLLLKRKNICLNIPITTKETDLL